jgi:hypothetical protein
MNEERHYVDIMTMNMYDGIDGLELDEGISELKRLADIVDGFRLVNPSSRDIAAMEQILSIIHVLDVPLRLPEADA